MFVAPPDTLRVTWLLGYVVAPGCSTTPAGAMGVLATKRSIPRMIGQKKMNERVNCTVYAFPTSLILATRRPRVREDIITHSALLHDKKIPYFVGPTSRGVLPCATKIGILCLEILYVLPKRLRTREARKDVAITYILTRFFATFST